MSNEDILKDVSRGMPVSQADKEKFKDRIEKRTLLKILITDTKLLRDAVHITEESKFFEKYPVCSLFWRTLYDYYISNDGVFPSMEMLKNGVYINLDQWRLVFGEDELSKEEIQSFIKDLELYRNISREDQESNRTYFRNFFNEHLKFYARDAYNELLEKGYELEEAKEEFNRIVNSCVSEEPSHKNGMEGQSWEDALEASRQYTRTSLNVPVMDTLLGGGLVKGEILMCVMPMGSGKTTLCKQLAYNTAMSKKHALYIPTEQMETWADLKKRNFALLTGYPRSSIFTEDENGVEQVDPEKIPEEAKINYNNNEPRFSHYYHVIDEFGGDTPLKSICQITSQAVDSINRTLPEGEEIEEVILDHWSSTIRKLGRNINSKVANDSSLMRTFEESCFEEIKSFAQEYDLPVIVFHQMTGAEAEKKAGSHKSAHMTKGNKMAAEVFDAVMVSDQPVEDEDSGIRTVEWLLQKSRQGGKNRMEVEFAPDESCFKPLDLESGSNIERAASPSKSDSGSKMTPDNF